MASKGKRLAKCAHCVAEGPSTHINCLHCDVVYCNCCYMSTKGSLLTKTGDGRRQFKCPGCHRNPRASTTTAPRPVWSGGDKRYSERPLTAEMSKGRNHDQHVLLEPANALFVNALRGPDSAPPTPAPKMDPKAEAVFDRLTDHRNFSGSAA
eukprot:m.92655 g.92655  ORF g.92655 m.92655 type:complete len:152 (-) comp51166_c0_seq1:540-995(-)